MFSQSIKIARSSGICPFSLCSERGPDLFGPLRSLYTLYRSRSGMAVWARVSSSSSASTHKRLSSTSKSPGKSKAATIVAGPSSPLNQTEYSADSSRTSPSSLVIKMRARRSRVLAPLELGVDHKGELFSLGGPEFVEYPEEGELAFELAAALGQDQSRALDYTLAHLLATHESLRRSGSRRLAPRPWHPLSRRA